MSAFGLGLKPTPAHERDMGRVLCGARMVAPTECTRRVSLALRGVNQGETNTCVAQALRNAIYTTTRILGLPPLLISALAAYRLACSRGFGPAPTDDGCFPCDMAQVLREVGVVLDAEWPFDASKVLQMPPFEALVEAPDRTWFWLERITDTGADRAQALRSVVAQDVMIVKGMAVDDRIFGWTESRPYTRIGPILGYHAELVPGYTREGPISISSWGMPDRVDSWRQIESDDVTELWAVRVDSEAIKAMSAGKGVV